MDEQLFSKFDEFKEYSLGYPCNLAYDYSPVFNTFRYNINNVGDPYVPSLYKTHTKEAEKDVLRFFKNLWQFDDNNSWGCLVESGTIGNLQGLYMGREAFPDGILYSSRESHYSIQKIAKILKLPYCLIRAHENGEMDYNDFEAKLITHKDKSAIICVNLGTTMKGAIDNPREIYRILCKHKKQNDFYMHGDGALMGFALPFLEYDLFFKKCLHSISISGHKFLGCPFPCGVFMMEKKFLDKMKEPIEYVGTIDNTISGSRNGHSAIFLDHVIKKKGYGGFKDDVMQCIDNSEYLIQQMHLIEKKAWRNNNSITVVIDKPNQKILDKWQLPSERVLSHVVVMPHVTKPKIQTFVRDLRILF